MLQALATAPTTEGFAAERTLLDGTANPLDTARGFVIGGLLSGTFWAAAALLVACLG